MSTKTIGELKALGSDFESYYASLIFAFRLNGREIPPDDTPAEEIRPGTYRVEYDGWGATLGTSFTSSGPVMPKGELTGNG